MQREEDDRLARIKAYNEAVKRGTDTAQQDMRDYHAAMTAEIIATRNATADAIRAAGLIQGIIADARAVGTSLAYNQTGSIIKQALAGGNGINIASVAPNGGGGGGVNVNGGIHFHIPARAESRGDRQADAQSAAHPQTRGVDPLDLRRQLVAGNHRMTPIRGGLDISSPS